MIDVGISLTSPAVNRRASGGLTPPEGFAFVVDENDAYVTNGDGAYVIAENI